ncbi:P-loop containing nucleoside triphosphate hydrolase protein [Podospora fimiseda]|uniref:DNA 3'-5' helicase n=1 Tax=Podospora fimiseda TaxID=252190 RepID=A0AAN6YKV8_9PEZI|nr:P-loop containing nucleoside triphosphate hydrolase protein [Podospora fimiseda]
MLGLKGLVETETQLVYLTATLRPSDEAEFGRLVGLPREGVRWFRGTTTRRNVQYQIRRYKTEEESEEDALAALAEEKKQKYGKQGQIIVYCDTVKKAVQYAKMLEGLCYHRGVGSQEEKKAIVRQLTEGRHQVFTATNALGLGVDAPTIRVVIHVGTVRRLRDYAQESGRAGRDREKSEAIILKPIRYQGRGRKQRRAVEETAEQAEMRGIERAMWEFLETAGCVRVVLDREMDGRTDRKGCEDGDERCYRCEAAAPVAMETVRQKQKWREEEDRRLVEILDEQETEGQGMSPDLRADVEVKTYRTRARRRKHGWDVRIEQSEEALEVERFKEILEEWATGCMWCRATGEEKRVYSGHRLEECMEEDSGVVRQTVERVRRKIRWEKYSGCFDCGIPQGICKRYRAKVDGGYERVQGGSCQFLGVLIESVVSMWGANSSEAEVFFQERMRQRGVEWDGLDEGELVKWMGRKVRWGGFESNEMCRAMVGLYKVHNKN